MSRVKNSDGFFASRIRFSPGFTLVELVLVVAIVAILASIAIPYYDNCRDKANNTQAIADIQSIELKLTEYFSENNAYPTSLSTISMQNLMDPWGNPYVYLNAAPPTKPGKLRKDHFMVPVNTDYDLYSKGKDEKSATPFTAAISQDDIVRANNGEFIGLVSDF